MTLLNEQLREDLQVAAELFEEKADVWRRRWKNNGEDEYAEQTMLEYSRRARRIRGLLTGDTDSEGEPVAWIIRFPNGDMRGITTQRDEVEPFVNSHHGIEPLYSRRTDRPED